MDKLIDVFHSGIMRGLLSAAAVLMLTLPFASRADETAQAGAAQSPSESQVASSEPTVPVTLAVAKDRARLMQQIYMTTLTVMHDRYFHADRTIVPARAMEDVFEGLERENGSQAHWISVNLRAMSINHDPKTDFEKQAAKELGSGKPEIELVEDGYYRRATPIALNGGCAGCHAGFSPQPSTKKFLAGLVISIPVTEAK